VGFPLINRFLDVKTIVRSAGTSMLDLVETIFSRHGIRSLRYDGKMDRAAKDATLAAFRQKGGVKVILVRYVSLLFYLLGSDVFIPVPNAAALVRWRFLHFMGIL
jgi:hypothetical protein